MVTKSGRALSEGCYMILAPSGDATPESSEIRALRKAVASGGTVEFVKWGQSIGEAAKATLAPQEAAIAAVSGKASKKNTPAVVDPTDPTAVEAPVDPGENF
jgi:predicted amidohydrolase